VVPPCCKKLIHGRVASGVFSRCEIHSPCVHPYCEGRRHRFLLKWPTGLDNNRVALGCFANPSTATPLELDPTLKRWLRYCQDWGYGWSWTVNVRSWRATDPSDVPDDVLFACQRKANWQFFRNPKRIYRILRDYPQPHLLSLYIPIYLARLTKGLLGPGRA